MKKRTILGIAAGVIAGATVIGVPAVAIASNAPDTGSSVPGLGQLMNDPDHLQQMRQWMSDPQHPEQMRQWMSNPQHVQQMGSMMDGVGVGTWNGMRRLGNQGGDSTP